MRMKEERRLRQENEEKQQRERQQRDREEKLRKEREKEELLLQEQELEQRRLKEEKDRMRRKIVEDEERMLREIDERSRKKREEAERIRQEEALKEAELLKKQEKERQDQLALLQTESSKLSEPDGSGGLQSKIADTLKQIEEAITSIDSQKKEKRSSAVPAASDPSVPIAQESAQPVDPLKEQDLNSKGSSTSPPAVVEESKTDGPVSEKSSLQFTEPPKPDEANQATPLQAQTDSDPQKSLGADSIAPKPVGESTTSLDGQGSSSPSTTPPAPVEGSKPTETDGPVTEKSSPLVTEQPKPDEANQTTPFQAQTVSDPQKSLDGDAEATKSPEKDGQVLSDDLSKDSDQPDEMPSALAPPKDIQSTPPTTPKSIVSDSETLGPEIVSSEEKTADGVLVQDVIKPDGTGASTDQELISSSPSSPIVLEGESVEGSSPASTAAPDRVEIDQGSAELPSSPSIQPGDIKDGSASTTAVEPSTIQQNEESLQTISKPESSELKTSKSEESSEQPDAPSPPSDDQAAVGSNDSATAPDSTDNEKQLEIERAKQLELERAQQLEMERVKRLEIEQAQQREIERIKQLELEAAKQLEIDRAKQLEIETAKQLEIERAKQLEIERNKQLEAEKAQQLEIERAKQLEIERAKQLEIERIKQLELEAAKQLEIDRAKQLEIETAKRLEIETAKQLEIEKTKQLEAERAKQLEIETAKQLEMERAKQLELEAAKQLEIDRAKQLEIEQAQQLEMERAKQLEIENAKLLASQRAEEESRRAAEEKSLREKKKPSTKKSDDSSPPPEIKKSKKKSSKKNSAESTLSEPSISKPIETKRQETLVDPKSNETSANKPSAIREPSAGIPPVSGHHHEAARSSPHKTHSAIPRIRTDFSVRSCSSPSVKTYSHYEPPEGHHQQRTYHADQDVRRDPRKRPKFSSKLRDMEVAKGSRIKLTCSVLGGPDTSVEWFRNGFPVTIDNQKYFSSIDSMGIAGLEIRNALRGDSGEYMCLARNQHGQSSSTADLRIRGDFEPKASPTRFGSSIQDAYKADSDELALETIIHGFPTPKITWMKDGTKLHLSSRFRQTMDGDGRCRLVIHSPCVGDSGQYSCVAQNPTWKDEISAFIVVPGIKFLI